jgi:hypothetical protein
MKIYKNICIFLGIYLGLRFISFFFPPTTVLDKGSIFNTLFSLAIVCVTSYFLLKKNNLGWYIITTEIILGGAGNFFDLWGVSLRTTLLLLSLMIFFTTHPIKEWVNIINENKKFSIILAILYAVVLMSVARGWYFSHSLSAIFSDSLPYLFLLYYFPFKKLLKTEQFDKFAFQCVLAAIIGNFIFIIFTFFAFSANIFHLQDTYYHWFRDVANGKITDLGYNFYRIVINEHLLLVPIYLLLFFKLLRKNSDEYKKYLQIAALLILGILAISLTRIYFLALVVGLITLFQFADWKRWLFFSTSTICVFMILFIALHTTASRGQSLGLELFGLRIQSIASPDIEQSSLSRKILLPKIMEKIKKNPLLGNGLGDSVTIFSPVVNKEITTPQFDWGYLEIIDELGVVGLVGWVLLITLLINQIRLCRNNKPRIHSTALYSSLGSLLVINLTSPALFHVFGIILITIFYLETTKHPTSAIHAS